MTTPEWLTRREGALRPGLNPQTWLVTFNGHPLYRLFTTTAQGQLTCAITQMNNGRRLDAGKAYPTVEGALTSGLEELREKLGW